MESTLTTRPRNLARLLGTDPDEMRSWAKDELREVLAGQLRVPLLEEFGPDAVPAGVDGSPLRTFEDLLQHPAPPLELLERTKTFAKSASHSGQGALPREISTVLYYAAILLARTCHGQRITTLDDASLLKGLRWALAQPWLTPQVSTLLQSGAAMLDRAD